MMLIDNVNDIVGEDLKESITKGSKVSVASAVFSIYAYQELKKQLESVDSFRFIFTSPTFLKEKAPRERREFYIPQISRERSIYGTEFEVRLRNELTQKAIARECADWIRRKAEFRSNITPGGMNSFLNIESSDDGCSYSPFNGFTTVDLGFEHGNSLSNYVMKSDYSNGKQFLNLFNSVWNNPEMVKDVKEMVLDSITAAYVENPPELIYFIALYNIFKEYLDDISEDYLPREGVGFRESKIWNMLYPFQKDAAMSLISKLDTYSGCILADSVGLGKTFTALAVIKYFESRNRNVLVLCPKKLSDNWNTYKGNYRNNPLREDQLRYDVLFHTDLSRRKGMSNGIDLSKIMWENYDLIVIDESHNFRNNNSHADDGKLNRYTRLLEEVVRKGIQTKVLMLSATPVNNRFMDLRNQLEVAFAGNPMLMGENLDVSRPIDEIFRRAQGAFNAWIELPSVNRTTDQLLKMLDFDFFTLLDSVTIARSRRHIEKYYGMDEIGKFPKRLKPISLRPNITDLPGAISYSEINECINNLNLAAYVPTEFLLASKRNKYVGPENTNRAGRERGIRRLMSISLLKRLESSIYSFRITVDKVRYKIENLIEIVDKHEKGLKITLGFNQVSDSDLDPDMDVDEMFAVEKKTEISLDDMDTITWRKYLENDLTILKDLSEKIKSIGPENDKKLITLEDVIREKIENPINPENRKVLIFSAFSDTADYLYNNLAPALKNRGINVGEVTGSKSSRSTIPEAGSDFNNILTFFSPVSKDRETLMPGVNEEIDVLIGTDCISEGQNLQDCDMCINYDIHWNPVRIIQRFGRVDRIGSHNDVIQLVNFWPDIDLDEYIQLKDRVEARMKASVLTSTGDDDPINLDEHGDLEYRKQQLMRLQDEVVDIEDMQSGVSIMDLGLNEFRADILEHIKTHNNLDNIPFGLHAVVKASEDIPPGVLFVLRNINDGVNIDKKNLLHPHYMVYVGNDGSIICDHLSPKKMLDIMRYTCKGKGSPDKELCDRFNIETKDGKDMKSISALLSNAIDSIIVNKEQSDLDAFFSGEDISFSGPKIKGIEDFELICFLVVR